MPIPAAPVCAAVAVSALAISVVPAVRERMRSGRTYSTCMGLFSRFLAPGLRCAWSNRAIAIARVIRFDHDTGTRISRPRRDAVAGRRSHHAAPASLSPVRRLRRLQFGLFGFRLCRRPLARRLRTCGHATAVHVAVRLDALAQIVQPNPHWVRRCNGPQSNRSRSQTVLRRSRFFVWSRRDRTSDRGCNAVRSRASRDLLRRGCSRCGR